MFDTASQRFVGVFLNVQTNTMCVFFSKYPKLGNTSDFWLIGANKYLNFAVFEGSDVAWMTKPAPGNIQTCPAQSSFMKGKSANLSETYTNEFAGKAS